MCSNDSSGTLVARLSACEINFNLIICKCSGRNLQKKKYVAKDESQCGIA